MVRDDLHLPKSDLRPMVKRFAHLPGLALNFSGATAPEWVQLLPAGPLVAGRDGRRWIMEDPDAVVSRFDPAKLPQIDIEHSSQLRAPKGEPAPAVGWIEALEVRQGAIWGRVSWTEEGERIVAGRQYRYLSPVFHHTVEGVVMAMVSAGLTNNPNLEMAALNSADAEETEMDLTAILDALGLKPNATAADAVLAINRLKDSEQTALNAAKAPDPAKFVPKADYDLAMNRVSDFETKEKERAEEAINAAVDQAIEEGKVAPASREYHLAACRVEGGLDRFKEAMNSAPVIAPKKDTPNPAAQPGKVTLSEDELAVCHMMGMSPETFAEAKAEEEK